MFQKLRPFKTGLFLGILIMVLFLIACKSNFSRTYSFDKNDGYYYHLISYETNENPSKYDRLFKVYLSFSNQNDSIFWDSYNNYKNSFVMKMDSSDKANALQKALYRFNSNDSGAILIRTKTFFSQQFNVKDVPFFSKQDSIVKINFKIKEELSEQEFLNMQQELLRKEYIQIHHFLGNTYDEDKGLDSLGFYWLGTPKQIDSATVKIGNIVSIHYEGNFLNGRFLERSPEHFDFIYGTPDQILKGLNYVIPRLKIGQTAKIILPSRLAFGETGSANGTVPPFTPLQYTIKLIDIKIK
ncbi:MAG: FKBP-type peptidyl-prolyl cis-trans isomerase [Bacteroidota bacterium]